MIIRLSISDNDFSHKIAAFCENLKDKMFSVDTHVELEDPVIKDYVDSQNKSEKDLQRLFDAIKTYQTECDKIKSDRASLMKPGLYFDRKSTEFKKIENEILRLWILYADEDVKRFVPNISLVKTIKEQDENGEAVYYMTAFNKTIIM